ncbi:hypothetical protein ABZ370_00545 [Streptomyces sp. NPDC005962]|uniref:hypothetical protein n=1 Tax=Streptomyces sp. NPDC005962 TaxID=3154466 RepID=UPI0033CD3675
MRIALAACVIHSDAPALLAELAAHRGLSKLALRQLAPTVLVSGSPRAAALAAPARPSRSSTSPPLETETYIPSATWNSIRPASMPGATCAKRNTSSLSPVSTA